MRIVVLWEDQRAPGWDFGPDLLLKSCISDDRSEGRYADWWKWIQPMPKKGKENLWKALQADLHDLTSAGSVVAVLDRDKAHELARLKTKPACRRQLLESLGWNQESKYQLVLLEDNLETLFRACCRALGLDGALGKPNPNRRDEIFHKVAFRLSSDFRAQVRKDVPSFDRLVKKIHEKISIP
jgi:hypothetical protein